MILLSSKSFKAVVLIWGLGYIPELIYLFIFKAVPWTSIYFCMQVAVPAPQMSTYIQIETVLNVELYLHFSSAQL